MALIPCKECGKDVSDLAESCPNCGCPVSLSINAIEEKEALENQSIIKKSNTFCMAGFILSILSVPFSGLLILLPIFATLFSILGINKFDKRREKNKWQGYIGLGLGLGILMVQVFMLITHPQF